MKGAEKMLYSFLMFPLITRNTNLKYLPNDWCFQIKIFAKFFSVTKLNELLIECLYPTTED